MSHSHTQPASLTSPNRLTIAFSVLVWTGLQWAWKQRRPRLFTADLTIPESAAFQCRPVFHFLTMPYHACTAPHLLTCFDVHKVTPTCRGPVIVWMERSHFNFTRLGFTRPVEAVEDNGFINLSDRCGTAGLCSVTWITRSPFLCVCATKSNDGCYIKGAQFSSEKLPLVEDNADASWAVSMASHD